MKATRFRVQNFRNVDDSGWIPLEAVTAFVGRNESGKTTLLKALHKFNPGSPEAYNPQREFPRDRYTSDYIKSRSSDRRWPVCSVKFDLSDDDRAEIDKLGGDDQVVPESVVATRYYGGQITFEYEPALTVGVVSPESMLAALETFATNAGQLEVEEGEPEGAATAQPAELVSWARGLQERLRADDDLSSDVGVQCLTDLLEGADARTQQSTEALIEELRGVAQPSLERAKRNLMARQIDSPLESRLPVFIYFEDYGILDSAIWLPSFLRDLERDPTAARVRTINAMFSHVGLDPAEIARLGTPQSTRMRAQGEEPTRAQMEADQEGIERRAILLNAASTDISRRFSEWWSQRRHKIRYHADGEYFRIWIADELRPDVEIELESRSKGFQWFLSFYLVFLVESEDGHKDAILLLDEPGLHLHPTAQQELIGFFETLSETNQIAYTTHSPFLIDGEHLHRVRPVTEDESGHSTVTTEEWPENRDTIFPLQAAAGYAMIQSLFAHRKNVLVEGLSDFYYLHALSQQCSATGRATLPEDIYITPCGGVRNVSRLASLFLGHDARPLVILDGDDAGRARQNALLRDLYAGHDLGIVMLDDVLGRPGQEVEIEDILGDEVLLDGLGALIGEAISLADDDPAASLPSRAEAAAQRQGAELPEHWKAAVARHLVSSWAERRMTLPDDVLDRAAVMFAEINRRFDALD